MRYSAVASLAFVGAVAAQNSTAGAAATGCVASYNTCRTTRTNGLSANQAQCASDNAACQGACYATYNTCRTTRTDGLSANQAQCVSEYATCLGENPLSPSGGLESSFIPYSATASSSMTSSAAAPVSTAACQASYNSCRTAPDANMSYCAAMYAKCLGFNPFEEGSLVTPTACSAQPEHTVYTTEVVNSYTTYCPYATTLVHGNKTIHVTEPGTVTVTDCPCTISKPMPQPTGPAAPPANPSTPAQPEQPEEGCNGADCPKPTGSEGCTGDDCVQPSVSVPAVVTPGPSDVPASAGRVVPGALIALGALALF